MQLQQAFWDYNLNEKEIIKRLKDGTAEEKTWIIGRIIEHLPFDKIWQYITLSELEEVFPKLRLRKENKKIWGYALSLWKSNGKPSH